MPGQRFFFRLSEAVVERLLKECWVAVHVGSVCHQPQGAENTEGNRRECLLLSAGREDSITCKLCDPLRSIFFAFSLKLASVLSVTSVVKKTCKRILTRKVDTLPLAEKAVFILHSTPLR